MSPKDSTPLTVRLREGVRLHDPHVRAAVDLLIWHEYWLQREDFRNFCIASRPGTTVIQWRNARKFHESRPGGSSTELAILDLAVALAEDRFRLSQMGFAHATAIIRAFTAALGEGD